MTEQTKGATVSTAWVDKAVSVFEKIIRSADHDETMRLCGKLREVTARLTQDEFRAYLDKIHDLGLR